MYQRFETFLEDAKKHLHPMAYDIVVFALGENPNPTQTSPS